MRKRLTPRQREIYEFIVDTVRKEGYPPTIREIGGRFNIVSTNGVRTTLFALEKKGYIRRKPKLSRGIELTDYIERERPDAPTREVPVVGKVAAGEPILAVENLEGMLVVDRTFVPSGDTFALAVRGDSMKNAGILDGDYVVARCQESADRGDIIVAIIEEEATVKRYVPERGYIKLMPENDAFDPIVLRQPSQHFRIAGKVIGLMRRL